MDSSLSSSDIPATPVRNGIDPDSSTLLRTTHSQTSGTTCENEKNGALETHVPLNLEDDKVKNMEKTYPDPYALEQSDSEADILGKFVVFLRSFLYRLIRQNRRRLLILSIIAAIILYHIYLFVALSHGYEKGDMGWCDGVGFLTVLTALTYWGIFYSIVLKGILGRRLKRDSNPVKNWTILRIFLNPYMVHITRFIFLVGLVGFIAIDARDQPKRFVSAAGVVAIILFGLLISKHPSRVKWGQIFWGLGLQFTFGLIVLRWESGREAFGCLGGKVKTFLDFTDAGTGMVYGYLATGLNETSQSGHAFVVPTVFFFKALSVVYFFSFFISILYYYGIMMWVISKVGWCLQITIGTTAAESMNAAANIFVGMNEAPLLIKPFLKDMTKSELHAVMTGGFATIAGSVMGAYISFGINPLYLLSASIMAAPAALTMSKLIYPETRTSRTTAEQMKSITLKTADSALDAAAQGATQGVMLVLNIAANLIAFLAFVSFLNSVFGWFGQMVGADDLSFEWLLGKLFIPLAYVIGVDPEEAEDVAVLLGLKTVVNEFVAYQKMTSESMSNLSARSKAIATYALCSFANFSAIGIQLGGIGFLAPERRADLVHVIWHAFISGSLCGLLNACLAGTLLNDPGYQSPLSLNSTFHLDANIALDI